MDTAEQERSRVAYWGLVGRVDELIGQMLEALTANGLRDRCLVVYTSDHGDMLGEHGLWWKHVFYEEAIRVPLIVSWPGVVASRTPLRECRQLRRRGRHAGGRDGRAAAARTRRGGALLPLIREEGEGTPSAVAWADEAFAEYCSDRYVPSEPVFQRMVRSGRWKLVYYHGKRPQLFDLREDPYELDDRSDDPACADIRAALTQRILEGWDPDAIARQLEAKEDDNRLIEAWARATRPADAYRWPLLPSMAKLEQPNSGD